MKCQSAKWHTNMSCWKQNIHVSKSYQKVTLITFFDNWDVLHHKFVPKVQIVSTVTYIQFLNCLRDVV
jgi:hypothetical protein